MTISYLYIIHCIVASAENWDTNLRGAVATRRPSAMQCLDSMHFVISWVVDGIRLYFTRL